MRRGTTKCLEVGEGLRLVLGEVPCFFLGFSFEDVL